jgi:hypothetical protein
MHVDKTTEKQSGTAGLAAHNTLHLQHESFPLQRAFN